MKLTPTRMIIGAVFGAASLVTSTASAQNFSYFYGENIYSGLNGAATSGGSYTDLEALPAGFDGGQIRDHDNDRTPNPYLAGTLVTAQAADILPPLNNPAYGGFSQTWDLGSGWGQNHTALGTEVIDQVIFYFYVSVISPLNSNNTFTIFSGLDGIEGTPADAFQLNDPNDFGTFYGVNVPVDVALSGFSIGVTEAHFPSHAFQTFNQLAADATQKPGFAVFTHIIPEPTTTALLGALGGLMLLRRRRG